MKAIAKLERWAFDDDTGATHHVERRTVYNADGAINWDHTHSDFLAPDGSRHHPIPDGLYTAWANQVRRDTLETDFDDDA